MDDHLYDNPWNDPDYREPVVVCEYDLCFFNQAKRCMSPLSMRISDTGKCEASLTEIINKKGKVMERNEVYELINGERDYQDNIVDKDPYRRSLEEHSVGDYLTMLDYYFHMAKVGWTTSAGTKEALDNIRKIAGICVKCMEEHGAPSRETK